MLTGENGVITKARTAKEEMEKATAKEKIQVEVAGSYDDSGKINIELLNKNLKNIEGLSSGLPITKLPTPVVVSGYEMSIHKNGEIKDIETVVPTTKVNETTIFSDKKSSNKEVVIPKGFRVSEIENEQTIDKGLVVIAPDGSEFVWVPVDSETLCADGIENKEVAEIANGADYRGVLYNFSGTSSIKKVYNDNGYREPAYLTDSVKGDVNTSEDHNTIGITQEVLQKEYNEIIKSIQKNGGFYIGKYESSLSDSSDTIAEITGTIQSKKGVMPTSVANAGTKTWYGLYKKQKEYATEINKQYQTNIKSGMIYGSMYDAVMNWALSDENEKSKVTSNSQKHGVEKTGALERDVIKNIYDLGNNVSEITVTAAENWGRVIRGRLYVLWSSS